MPLAAIFLIAAWGVLFAAQIIEGGKPASLFTHPAPLLLVFGVTMAITLAAHGMGDIKVVLKSTIRALLPKKLPSTETVIETLTAMADVNKKSGLMGLEKQLEESGGDPFLRRGVELILDGADSERLEDILFAEVEAMEERHRVGAAFWKNAGGYAPTIGILGTVMSLVHVLENLAEPESLGGSISAAFLATFWGVASANVIYLPLATKMKRLTEVEKEYRTLIIDGLLDIQAGRSAREVGDKLKVRLRSSARSNDADKDSGKDAK